MKKFTDWQNDEWLKEKNKNEYREFVPMYRDQVKLLMKLIKPDEELPPKWQSIISILYAIWQFGFTGQEWDPKNPEDIPNNAKNIKPISELSDNMQVFYRLIAHTVRTSRTHAANKKRPKIETPQDNTTE